MPEREYSTHEILLENRHLAFVGAGVVVLCMGAFLLGRWSERSRWESPDTSLPQPAGVTAQLPIEGGAPPAAQAGREENGFSGEEILPGESPAGPEAPARSDPSAPRAEKPPQPGMRGDDLYIQVIATRHADAAQVLRERLAQRQYPAAVVSSPDGEGRPLYRVRVGGYGSRREAEQVALRLQKEEHLRTWIPK